MPPNVRPKLMLKLKRVLRRAMSPRAPLTTIKKLRPRPSGSPICFLASKISNPSCNKIILYSSRKKAKTMALIFLRRLSGQMQTRTPPKERLRRQRENP
tara:strand:- start:334 stop:630 length:297 start_codon:yes stop_codon:yes gene_type:complete